MRFNVSGLLQEGIGASRAFRVDAAPARPGEGRLRGDLEMLRTKDGILVRAQLETAVAAECSRCLSPLEEPLRIEFEEEFQPTVDVLTGASLRPEDRDAFTIDAHHTLDLAEAVRQYREVSLLMQPLCRPDCKGLCPECGKDRNLSDCACAGGPVDGRWAGLAALKQAAGGKE
jgi:uncharacterized protein